VSEEIDPSDAREVSGPVVIEQVIGLEHLLYGGFATFLREHLAAGMGPGERGLELGAVHASAHRAPPFWPRAILFKELFWPTHSLQNLELYKRRGMLPGEENRWITLWNLSFFLLSRPKPAYNITNKTD
jgi:hypothetical protein